jgi:adenylate cyclase
MSSPIPASTRAVGESAISGLARLVSTRLRVLSLRFARNARWMLLAALLTTTAAVVWHHFDWFDLSGEEFGKYDAGLTAFTRRQERSSDIVIVAIDDRTFRTVAENPSYAISFGSWPYSRNIWARVFEHLVDEGARAVVFDAVIDEPHTDPSGDLAMAEVIGGGRVPFYLGFSVVASTDDRALPPVSASNRTGSETSIDPPSAPTTAEAAAPEQFPGDALTFEETIAADSPADEGSFAFVEDESYPRATGVETAEAIAFPVTTTDLTLPDLRMRSGGDDMMQFPVPPIAPLIPVARGFGLVLPEEDADGKLRRTRFAYTDGVNTYVTLPVAVAADLFAAERVEISPGRLQIGEREYQINPGGDAEIDYGGELHERFQTVSLAAVLDDWALRRAGQARRLPDGLFSGKVVMIAGFAVGTADVKPTPFSSLSPSVVKQAAVLQNLLDGGFIIEAPYAVSVLTAFLVAFSCLTIIVVVRSAWLEVGIPLFLYFCFYLFTGYFLGSSKTHILSVMPTMAGEIACFAAVAFNRVFLSGDRDHYREVFGHVMEPDRVDLLSEQRRLPSLRGEQREVTAIAVVLLDLPSVAASRRETPQAIADVLGLYRNAITSALLRAGGCIGRHSGRTLTCLFGAPLAEPQHAVRACRAALAVRHAVEDLGQTLRRNDLPELRIGIGVRSGAMFVGNLGTDHLLEYTAIGRGMDLTIQVAKANERFASVVLLDGDTAELVQSEFDLQPRGEVQFDDDVEKVTELIAARAAPESAQPLPPRIKLLDNLRSLTKALGRAKDTNRNSVQPTPQPATGTGSAANSNQETEV